MAVEHLTRCKLVSRDFLVSQTWPVGRVFYYSIHYRTRLFTSDTLFCMGLQASGSIQGICEGLLVGPRILEHTVSGGTRSADHESPYLGLLSVSSL